MSPFFKLSNQLFITHLLVTCVFAFLITNDLSSLVIAGVVSLLAVIPFSLYAWASLSSQWQSLKTIAYWGPFVIWFLILHFAKMDELDSVALRISGMGALLTYVWGVGFQKNN